MFPAKSMDYVSEMNKLFPRPSENEIHQPYNMATQSPFNQSLVNRSSSSADSTSPESFPDLATFQPEYRPDLFKSAYDSAKIISDTPRTISDTPRRLYDSHRSVYDYPGPCDTGRPICETSRPICATPNTDQPFIRRQRPIMGRKYVTKPDNFLESAVATPVTKIPEDLEFRTSIWQDDGLFQRTPPNNSLMEQRYNTYELFPTETRSYEYQTPVKSTANISPAYSNVSPTMSNVSPSMNISPSFSHNSPNTKLSTPMQSFNFSPPCTNTMVIPKALDSPAPSTSSMYSQDIQPGKMCTFCRKNGETPIVYMTHWVRERVRNKSIVTCPILRSHICSTCGATGDNAHTITYCPVLRSNNNGLPLQSTTITLKNTRVKSNGRRRY